MGGDEVDLYVFIDSSGRHVLARLPVALELPPGDWTYVKTYRINCGVGSRELLRAVADAGYFELDSKPLT